MKNKTQEDGSMSSDIVTNTHQVMTAKFVNIRRALLYNRSVCRHIELGHLERYGKLL